MAEFANRGSGVGLRVADVAGARRAVFRWDIHSLDLLQQRPDLIQRIATSIACVKDLAGHAGGRRSLDYKIDYVIDVGEVAGLLAIAINRGEVCCSRQVMKTEITPE